MKFWKIYFYENYWTRKELWSTACRTYKEALEIARREVDKQYGGVMAEVVPMVDDNLALRRDENRKVHVVFWDREKWSSVVEIALVQF